MSAALSDAHPMEEHLAERGTIASGMNTHPWDRIVRAQCYCSFKCEEPLRQACIDDLGYGSLLSSADDRAVFPCSAAHFSVTGPSAARLYGLEVR